MPQLSQSTIMLGALLVGFVFWLAVNDRLGLYWGFLTGTTSSGK